VDAERIKVKVTVLVKVTKGRIQHVKVTLEQFSMVSLDIPNTDDRHPRRTRLIERLSELYVLFDAEMKYAILQKNLRMTSNVSLPSLIVTPYIDQIETRAGCGRMHDLTSHLFCSIH